MAAPVTRLDSSPAAPPASDSASADMADIPTGDGYGSKTLSLGVPIVLVCPPKAGKYTRLDYIQYLPAGTAHTITAMVTLFSTSVATDVALNGTTITGKQPLSATEAGGAAAAGDWIVTIDQNGKYVVYQIASVTGAVNTITTTSDYGDANGTGVSSIIEQDAPLYFMGAPGNHSKRQFLTVASTLFTVAPPLGGIATATRKNQPILVHSDNATAAGSFKAITYSNVRL